MSTKGTINWSNLLILLQLLEQNKLLRDPALYTKILQLATRVNSPDDLRFKIAALVAENEREQQLVYELFDKIFSTKVLTEDNANDDEAETNPDYIDDKPATRRIITPRSWSSTLVPEGLVLLSLLLILVVVFTPRLQLAGLITVENSFFFVLLAILIYWSITIFREPRKATLSLSFDGTELQQFRSLRLPDYQFIDFGNPLKRQLTQFRQRFTSENTVLNVPKTIRKSTQKGGLLQPVFSYRTHPPSYLLLIDYTHVANHRSQLYEAFFRWLKEEQVPITRYYYSNEPLRCWNEQYPQGIPLQRIVETYANDRLLIMGDCWQFLHATDNGLADWVNLFNEWKEKAILTPIDPGQWTYREMLLERVFLLAPANTQGFKFVNDHFEQLSKTNTTIFSPAPSSNSGQISEEHFSRDFRAFFPEPELREWLAILSFFPKLNWNLTLYLGEVLSKIKGYNLITFENLSKLSRLNWFYNGFFPKAIQDQLYDTLTPALQTKIHYAIAQWLENQGEDEKYELGNLDRQKIQIALHRSAAGIATRKEKKLLRKEIPHLDVSFNPSPEAYAPRVPDSLLRQLSRRRSLNFMEHWQQFKLKLNQLLFLPDKGPVSNTPQPAWGKRILNLFFISDKKAVTEKPRYQAPGKDAQEESEIFHYKVDEVGQTSTQDSREKRVYQEVVANRGVFEGKLTEEEAAARAALLNNKITNLVFLFGDVASSKTTVLTALSSYFRRYYLMVENSENSEANSSIQHNRKLMRQGRFPKITDIDILYEYDLALRKSINDDWLNLTFVEMSGEYQREVSFDRSGKLLPEVSIYVKENELPLLVFLVVGYDELMRTGPYAGEGIDIDNQDTLLASFINYLVSDNIQCENIGIIFTKMDKDRIPNLNNSIEELAKKLSETMAQIKNISMTYKIFPFSVGKIIDKGWDDGEALIEQLDLSDCQPIIEWIYDVFTEEYNPPPRSIFQRIINLFMED